MVKAVRWILLLGLLAAEGLGCRRRDDDENPPENWKPPSLGKNYELIHAALLYRHTIRAPIWIAPQNSYLSASMFPRGLGYSTSRGIKFARETGFGLRKRYSDLVGDANPRRAYVRSSDSDRCAETTETIVRAMFEGKKSEDNPVPVTRAPAGHDRFNNVCGVDQNTPEPDPYNMTGSPFKKFPSLGHVYELIRQNDAGLDADETTVGLGYIDATVAAAWEGIKFPSFIRENFDVIHWAVGRQLQKDSTFGPMRPYQGYHLLQELADRLETIANGGKLYGTKLTLYGYHDTHVRAVAAALGGDDYEPFHTGFISAMFFDVFANKNNQTDMRVLVGISKGLDDFSGRKNGKVPSYSKVGYSQIEKFKLLGCENPCPIRKFITILRGAYNEVANQNCGCYGDNAMV